VTQSRGNFMTTAALSASNTGDERYLELPSQTLVGGQVVSLYTRRYGHVEEVLEPHKRIPHCCFST
jgi:hypothetical protein